MKKITVLLVLLCLLVGCAFAEDSQIFSFKFDQEEAGSGEMLDLSKYSVKFFLPEQFIKKSVENNVNAICYYERENPKHSVEFLLCDYTTLDEARKEYMDVTPVNINVNGMNGVTFAYMSTKPDGEVVYVTDSFLEVPGYGILNFYEESETEAELAQYMGNVMSSAEPKATDSSAAVAVVTENAGSTASSGSASNAPAKKAVDPADIQGKKVRTQNDGSLNVRKTPDANGERVGVAGANTLYPLLSISENGWYEIELRDGITGYISPKLCRIVD